MQSIAGAWDAVLAAIAWSLAERISLEEGLRLGTAAAGAVIMTPDTADCRHEDLERLLPLVQVLPYP